MGCEEIMQQPSVIVTMLDSDDRCSIQKQDVPCILAADHLLSVLRLDPGQPVIVDNGHRNHKER